MKTNTFRQIKPSVYAVLKGGSATAAQIQARVSVGTHKQVVMALVELKQEGLIDRAGRKNQAGIWKVKEGNYGS